MQLYPGNPNHALVNFLRDSGASPEPVLPYRYANDAEAALIEATIRAMAEGRVDAIAFTSSPQVGRLKEVAAQRGVEKELALGLARTRVAAVGPVVAAAIEALGGKIAVMPQASFHMKPLVNAIAAALNAPEDRHA